MKFFLIKWNRIFHTRVLKISVPTLHWWYLMVCYSFFQKWKYAIKFVRMRNEKRNENDISLVMSPYFDFNLFWNKKKIILIKVSLNFNTKRKHWRKPSNVPFIIWGCYSNISCYRFQFDNTNNARESTLKIVHCASYVTECLCVCWEFSFVWKSVESPDCTASNDCDYWEKCVFVHVRVRWVIKRALQPPTKQFSITSWSAVFVEKRGQSTKSYVKDSYVDKHTLRL